MATRIPTLLFVALGAVVLSACASRRQGFCPKSANSISPETAIDIAVAWVHINDRTKYKLDVSEGGGDYVGYLVYYEAIDEGGVPSFGVVAVDYCGKVWGVSKPL